MKIIRDATPGAGSYVNETDYFQADWKREFWGENYERLLAIKHKYDPGGLFFCHHCVGSDEPRGAARTEPVSAIGTWRGQSLCTVKPSSCNDEVIVYHFARGKSDDTVVLTGNKIVGGKEVTMGVVDCTVSDAGRALSCPIPNGIFRYRIDGRALSGTLTVAGEQLFRRINATRSE